MQYVLIHGLGQNSSSWNEMVSLMGKSLNFQCPDLFQLVDSKNISYQSLYTAFSEYCNGIDDSLNLCGLSLGGVLALNYAIDHPEKVQSLVLIAAQYKMPKALLKLQNAIFSVMPESIFNKMGFKKKNFIALAKSMIDLDFSQKLRKISCPTLIICGMKDKANKKAAKELSEKVSGATFCFIENANHEVNIDNPERLALELKKFFS